MRITQASPTSRPRNPAQMSGPVNGTARVGIAHVCVQGFGPEDQEHDGHQDRA